jgi:Subtilase family/MBG domain
MTRRLSLRLAAVLALLTWIVTPAAAAQYILELVAGADIAQVAANYGLVLVRPLGENGEAEYLVACPDPVPPNLVQQLVADPSILQVEQDAPLAATEMPSGAPTVASTSALAAAISDNSTNQYYGTTVRNSYVQQPAASLIRLPDTLLSFATGSGIVAVIDTGVDATHPALQSVLVPGYDFTSDQPGLPSDLADLNQSTVAILDQSTVAILDSKQSPLLLDQSTVAILDQSTAASLGGTPLPSHFGHGTMVAGLIHLVAPTASIMPLKAFRADGSANLSDIVRAIYYAVDNGAKVINMSFSSTTPSISLFNALAYAATHNVICIASGGNAGVNEVVYPAATSEAWGVGSTNALDQRSLFSDYGWPSVQSAAPGEALITTYPGNNYAGVWGTSFSTALVSGTIALLVQIGPGITPYMAANTLKHGHPLDDDLGLGRARLDVYASVGYYLSHANAATITLSNLSATYDGTPKQVTATTNPPGLAVTYTYNGNATPPTAAGSYSVVGSINDPKYIGSQGGTLVVAKAAAKVTLGSLSITYDSTPKTPSVVTSPPGLSVAFTYDDSTTVPSAAGSYSVVATVNDPNYAGSQAGTLLISHANATITLGNLSATYDGTPKQVTATTNPPSLPVTFTYNGNATPPTAAGPYSVVGTINDPNYAGSQSGTLVIAKATATVTLGSLSITYDGTPKAASAVTNPPGLSMAFTYNGSASAPTAAGSYSVVGTVNDPNYSGSQTGNLVVSQANATIMLGNLSATYDGTAKLATATTNPPALNVTFSYNGNANAPIAAGSYTVVATVNDPNYNGTQTGTLVVNQAIAVVTVTSITVAFDGTAKSAPVATTPANLNVVVTYNGAATTPVSPGVYNQVAIVTDGNYTGSGIGTVTIQ